MLQSRPDCPECGEPMAKPYSSCKCGWRSTPQKKQPEKPRVCAFNDHGYTCGQPGFLSRTTNGEGPWFCRQHFARIMNWPDWSETAVKPLSIAVEEMTRDIKEPYRSRAMERQKTPESLGPISEVDKRVNKLVPRLPGESDHDWSMRCKDWVLARIKRGVLREPGGDEREAA